jgi:flagellar hook-associated protein 1 FlgK
MALLNVLQSGKSGMTTAKAGIATSGHNIANANTEGYSRQRVQTEAVITKQLAGQGGPYTGEGSKISRIERINDDYINRQLREGHRDMAYQEEKGTSLHQVEEVFNEMNGDGLNRITAQFFNDFRKLSNDPSSEAIRQAVRESSQAMVNDFHRLRGEVEAIRGHIDTRIDGNMRELNSQAEDLAKLNLQIRKAETQGDEANDLQDKRDQLLQSMNKFVDLAIHKDNLGMVNVEVRGLGPLVTGPTVTQFHVGRAPAVTEEPNRLNNNETRESSENSLQISRSEYGNQYVTSGFQGGRVGALIETRDKTVSMVLERLDQLAFGIANAVNEVHEQGFTADGQTGISYFKNITDVAGASQMLGLSDEVKGSVSNIAVALEHNAPGDNRNALAIANIQNSRLMNNGHTSVDDFYNSIVSDVGVAAARNAEALGQQKNILTQLTKVRDQVSGVSIDEETTNLMQFQHAFDASAKVIKVADEMMDTILKLRG